MQTRAHTPPFHRGCTAWLALAAVLVGSSAVAAEPRGTNLLVIIDRQMSVESFETSRRAVVALVKSLGPNDRVGLIAVGDDELSQTGSDLVSRHAARVEAWLARLQRAKSAQEIGLGPPMEMADGLLALTANPQLAPRIVLVSNGAHVTGVVSEKAQRERVQRLAKGGVRIDAVTPGTPLDRTGLEALAELGNGHLVILKVDADVKRVLSE